ncbi:MAG TPA: DUF1634 domain-containing protein [Bryobacteraceae bacterium]|nr:DUF1634 domain-containing protein [Bryobacteraceae bacterium]
MRPLGDPGLELILSRLLRTGVLLSALVVLAGAACFLSTHGKQLAAYHAFHAAPDAYRSVRGVVHATGTGDCRAIIQLGLLLLIATPIARVAFSLVAFWLERDWKFVALTATVLTILIYSLAGQH